MWEIGQIKAGSLDVVDEGSGDVGPSEQPSFTTITGLLTLVIQYELLAGYEVLVFPYNIFQ